MSDIRKLLRPHWAKWLPRDDWMLKQGVALCAGLDPDRVCKNPEIYKTVPNCYMQVIAYMEILDALESSVLVQDALHDGKGKVSKVVIIDWFTEQGGVLCAEVERHIHLISCVDEIMCDEGQKPGKRVAIARKYADYAEIEIKNGMVKVSREWVLGKIIQTSLAQFLKGVKQSFPAGNLKGLFGIHPHEIQKSMLKAREPHAFIHGHKSANRTESKPPSSYPVFETLEVGFDTENPPPPYPVFKTLEVGFGTENPPPPYPVFMALRADIRGDFSTIKVKRTNYISCICSLFPDF